MCLLVSCGDDDYTPKPQGYFRIDLPKKAYVREEFNCPFSFEIPVYTNWTPDREAKGQDCWININYPQFKGKIHLTYKPVHGNLVQYLEDARNLTDAHIPKAVAIDETLVADSSRDVYGLIYDVKGTGAASTMQFFVTDSSEHFLRGALYFDVEPNNDSLAPVINFIKEDIHHLIETVEWE